MIADLGKALGLCEEPTLPAPAARPSLPHMYGGGFYGCRGLGSSAPRGKRGRVGWGRHPIPKLRLPGESRAILLQVTSGGDDGSRGFRGDTSI